MKKIITIFLLFFTLSLTQAQTNESDMAKKYGLVSYLTSVKALAEFKMSTLAQDSRYKETQNKSKITEFNSKYNLLKLLTDQLINQLSADSYNSNRLKVYRSVNHLLKNKKSLPGKYAYFEEMITQIDGVFLTFSMAKYGSSLSGPSIEEYTGVAVALVDAVTSARDFREKKIQSITALLKELKLQSLGDLTKPKDKKE